MTDLSFDDKTRKALHDAIYRVHDAMPGGTLTLDHRGLRLLGRGLAPKAREEMTAALNDLADSAGRLDAFLKSLD